jgi:phage shock protein C
MTDGSEDDLYDPGQRRRSTRGSSSERADHSRTNRSADSRDSNEFQRAVDRFEEAVQDLVGSATSEFSDRATSFLNETTAKLEKELGGVGSRSGRDRDAVARMAARRRARARYRSERMLERSPRLCRDDENAKIVGVCAGIANYYGVESWVVRCIAVTGLLFFGSIVFPAYWIMYFVMDDPDSEKQKKRERRRGRRGRTRRSRKSEAEMVDVDPMPELHTSDTSPRRNLRNVQTDLREVELRLRRMETHVTSGQYELQRELNKIDVDDSAAGSAR